MVSERESELKAKDERIKALERERGVYRKAIEIAINDLTICVGERVQEIVAGHLKVAMLEGGKG